MPEETIQYVIFAPHENKEDMMLVAPVRQEERDYLVKGIIPTLQPLSDNDYVQGPAVILHTLARSSYILAGDDLYWCVEWDPGLIVVRFSPDGSMAWSALRSPIPEFGGRTPTEQDLESYDEDAEDHQYNLVFHAWDAQFEEDKRAWRSFTRAEASTAAAYRRALAHANALGEQMQASLSEEADRTQWRDRCKENIATWAGDGIRIGAA